MNRKADKHGARVWNMASHRPAGDSPELGVAEAMDCAGFDLQLAEVLRRSELPLAARMHLGDCAQCAAKLDDFETIADSVRQLSVAVVDPVPNQWVQLREALLREGIIHANGRACADAPATPKLVKK